MKTIAARELVRAGGEIKRRGYVEESVAIEDEWSIDSISISPRPGARFRGRGVMAFRQHSSQSHGRLRSMNLIYKMVMNHHYIPKFNSGQPLFPWAGDIKKAFHVSVRSLHPVAPGWPVAESFPYMMADTIDLPHRGNSWLVPWVCDINGPCIDAWYILRHPRWPTTGMRHRAFSLYIETNHWSLIDRHFYARLIHFLQYSGL